MLWNQDEASIITQYQLDGAVCIRQVLGPQEISTLTRGIEKNLRDLSPRSKVASRPDDPGYFVEDFCTWQTNPFYQDLIFNSQLGEVAAKLTNSRCIRLYHDHLLVKEAGTLQATPWHQDQPYYNIDGFQNCSIWIPVDPISPKAALRFISGSHLGPWLMPRSFMDQQAKWFPEGSLAELPDIERNPQDYELNPGPCSPGISSVSICLVSILPKEQRVHREEGLFRSAFWEMILFMRRVHGPPHLTFPGLQTS